MRYSIVVRDTRDDDRVVLAGEISRALWRNIRHMMLLWVRR